jgi:acetolactate synthase-1/3 small subunit
LNINKALFTVVVNETTEAVTNLVKQLSKLVKVKYVENVTDQERLDRELMLIKVKAENVDDKSEIIQTAGIFRAKVVDAGETSVTLSSAGDPGKSLALQQNLQKFGVMEVARTGKISLKRGLSTIQDAGGNIQGRRNKGTGSPTDASVDEEENFNLEEGIAMNESPADSVAESLDEDETGMGDVYMLDEEVSVGIWEVGYLPGEQDQKKAEVVGEEMVERHTVSVLVQDSPGVLQQVTSVFARRGYNMQSLAVGNAEEKGLSRISLVVPGTKSSIVNLGKQLEKLLSVKSFQDLTEVPHNSRELMLIKCKCDKEGRKEIIDLCAIFRSKVCDISKETVTLEIEGSLDKMAAFQKMLVDYEILEVARTGRIALSRGSGVDSRFLERRGITSIL